MRPMPPSSPAMNTPRTLVSKCGSTRGMSTPRRSLPNTSVIACTGHDASHAPWPMQAAGDTSVARPATRPSASSGHARTHPPDPMQRNGSTVGWSDGGSVRPAAIDPASSRACAASARLRRTT